MSIRVPRACLSCLRNGLGRAAPVTAQSPEVQLQSGAAALDEGGLELAGVPGVLRGPQRHKEAAVSLLHAAHEPSRALDMH